ncbi:MAG TPA: DUF2182 domain-containing protein [Egibacteraceae bacterium]|nr:DUF2182 domain-containing protein [Egibacteraceae bacterium]
MTTTDPAGTRAPLSSPPTSNPTTPAPRAGRSGPSPGGGGRLPVAVPVAISLAWLAALLAEVTGTAGRFGHDAVLGQGPDRTALLAFLLAWQVMVVAMMLPSAIPLIRLFAGVAANQSGGATPGGAAKGAALDDHRHVRALIGGYLAVWTAIGVVAFLADGAVHALVGAAPAIGTRPWLEAGALALAGAFQFTALKDRCLAKCRHPAAYLLPRYRRGVDAAFRLGIAHGLFCVGCCWALMLVMFAIGMADLRWMAALAAVMIYEKVGRHGVAAARLAGGALLTLAAAVLAGG